MSAGTNGTPATGCAPIRAALSEYRDGDLGADGDRRVAAHLRECAACRQEDRELAATLSILRERVPAHEPALDIWVELGPKVADAMAEERLSLPARWRLRSSRFAGNVAAGAILFTHALAAHTDAKMRRYLIQDPFRLAEED